MEGYIKLHRKIFDNWIFERGRPLTYFESWVLLLSLAAYTRQNILIEGKLIVCNRGQIVRSIKSLSLLFNWSEKRVKHFLKLLKQDGMIITQGLARGTIITVCNYDIYQDFGRTEVPTQVLTQVPTQVLAEGDLGASLSPTEGDLGANSSPHIIKDNTDNKEKNVNNLLEQKGDETASAVSGVVSEKDLKNGFEKSKKNDGVPRKKAGRPPAEIERFDPWLEQEDFRGAWAAWLAMRRGKNNPAGRDAQRIGMTSLKSLSENSIEKAIEIVNYSTLGGYPRFYALEKPKQGKNGKQLYNADTVNGTEHDYSITR
jgi:DNA replication protein DnaD